MSVTLKETIDDNGTNKYKFDVVETKEETQEKTYTEAEIDSKMTSHKTRIDRLEAEKVKEQAQYDMYKAMKESLT